MLCQPCCFLGSLSRTCLDSQSEKRSHLSQAWLKLPRRGRESERERGERGRERDAASCKTHKCEDKLGPIPTLLCRGGQPVDNSTRRVLLDLVHRRSRRSRRRRRVYTPPGTPQSNARTSERQGYAKFHIDRQKPLRDGSPRVLRDAPGSPQSATRGHRNQSAIDRNRQQSPTWDTGKT